MRFFADESPMMGEDGDATAVGPIQLAKTGDFSLGPFQVRPSLREVACGARNQTLEPRVMQVLVALARANGAVVSRQDLIDACWEGRIVGEDAINRCIGRLRRLSADLGADAFEIITVARVGYRLIAKSAASAERPRSRALFNRAALVAGGMVIALVGVTLHLHLSVNRPWVVDSSRLLDSNLAIERHPAISPDGATIAYSGGPYVLSRQIYLRPLAGGDPVRFTSDAGDHVSAAWSPDGKNIAFVLVAAGRPCRVMTARLSGGPARTVAACQTDERSQVAWSHSGKSLYLVDRPSAQVPDRIEEIDLASGARRDVTRPPAGGDGDRSIGLSPDGRWISFERDLSAVLQPLIVRNLMNGSERILPKPADLSPGGWTEDSRDVLLAGRVNGDNVIWAYPIDGGRPTHLLSGPLQVGRISSGPQGWAAVEVNTEIYSLASAPAARGGRPVVLDPSKAVDGGPAVSSRGDIAMAAWRSGEAGIWIKPRGGALHKLVGTPPDTYLDGPSFSPDGSKLAFPTEAGGRLAIRVVGVDGAELGSTPFSGTQLGVPAWAPDGRSLIFAGRDAKGWRLWRADLAHTAPPTPASGYGWLSVQARGGELYGVRADSPGVWRIDGTPRRITTRPSSAYPNLWTIAGDAIDYVDDPFGHPPHIVSQPISGGPARVIADAPGYAYDKGFDVDPLTGKVLYAATRADETDLELLKLGRG